MTILTFKDKIKTEVELASGGKQTVIFSPSGQPCIMNVFHKFNIEDVAPEYGITGVHPAFKFGDKVASKIYIGTYAANNKNSEVVSQPGLMYYGSNTSPRSKYSLANLDSMKSKDMGWHLMTHVERSMLNCLALKHQFIPATVGRLTTDLSPIQSQLGGLMSGSSGTPLRHDGSYTGIEATTTPEGGGFINYGVRIVDNEFQVFLEDNSCALEKNWASLMGQSTAAGWLAFDATTGALVTPTFSGSFELGNYKATTQNTVRITKNQSPADNEYFSETWGALVIDKLPEITRKKLELYCAYPQKLIKNKLKTFVVDGIYTGGQNWPLVGSAGGSKSSYSIGFFATANNEPWNYFEKIAYVDLRDLVDA